MEKTISIIAACVGAALSAAGIAIPSASADPIEPRNALPAFPKVHASRSANPPPAPNAVAASDCVNNTMPGGPPFARTEKFADQNTLNNAFQTDARSTALQPCPGSSDSAPATWNATNPPPASGSVMCYTSSDNMAHVEWTNIPDRVKVNASGPDMTSLALMLVRDTGIEPVPDLGAHRSRAASTAGSSGSYASSRIASRSMSSMPGLDVAPARVGSIVGQEPVPDCWSRRSRTFSSIDACGFRKTLQVISAACRYAYRCQAQP